MSNTAISPPRFPLRGGFVSLTRVAGNDLLLPLLVDIGEISALTPTESHPESRCYVYTNKNHVFIVQHTAEEVFAAMMGDGET